MMIKFFGKDISRPELRIPGYAGSTTNDQVQPWHLKTFTDYATSGIELLYPYEDTTIPEVTSPFIQVNDYWFLLEMELVISTPNRLNLLIIPHYRFYTDMEWVTPIPVASSVQTDWWPNLTILFKMPPKGYVTKFKKDEPFAQAFIISRDSLKVNKMTDKEMERSQKAKLYIDGNENLATRDWITSTGFVQNNLYEVLSHLESKGQLPEEIKSKKKYKLM